MTTQHMFQNLVGIDLKVKQPIKVEGKSFIID